MQIVLHNVIYVTFPYMIVYFLEKASISLSRILSGNNISMIKKDNGMLHMNCMIQDIESEKSSCLTLIKWANLLCKRFMNFIRPISKYIMMLIIKQQI